MNTEGEEKPKENKAKNKLSTQEWDQFVTEKNEKLEDAKVKMLSLVELRADILMAMAEGDDSAYDDLRECDENTVRTNAEIESIKMLLETVPARRAYSEGVECEALIPKVEKVSGGISPLVADIRRKATLLEMSCKKLDDHLQRFGELDITSRVKPDLRFAGIRNLRSLGSIASSNADTGIKIDEGVIWGAIALDKKGLSAWVDGVTADIDKRLGRVQEHASRLKGEDLEELSEYRTYCPHCFSDTQPWTEGGVQKLCPKCMKGF